MHTEDESKPLSTVSTESTYQKGAQIAIEIQHKIIHESKIIQDETSQNRKTPIGFRDNQARTDDFHHVKVTLYR